MIEEELHHLIQTIHRRGCPEKLCDTLSAFSNQDNGGVLVFGLDEPKNFEVMEYGEQMTPAVHPVFTVCDENEAVLNALVHRDYSVYGETKPVMLNIYDDRLEITNPGGLYGRITIDQLGHVQPDARNPILATALEILHETENRYSGIPTIKHAMEERRARVPRLSPI